MSLSTPERIGEVPRLVQSHLEEAISDNRVVWLGGPRQAGKTTLAKQVAQDEMPFVSLDDGRWRDLAQSQPAEFLQRFDRAIIDEIQFAPELVSAIELEVDSDQRRGRFLLTGSANFRKVPRISDSLAGRVEMLRLMPLSQAEIRGGRGDFLSTVFAGGIPETDDIVTGPDFVETVLAGGFPEPVVMKASNCRRGWFGSYVETIIVRDISLFGDVDQPLEMLSFVRALALFSGKTSNSQKVGKALAMDPARVEKYLQQLEYMYFIQELPNWRPSRRKRSNLESKILFLDSGLLANLLNAYPDTLASDHSDFGARAVCGQLET